MNEAMRDGEWWAWNGGECPVHPKDVVQVQYRHETRLEVLAEDEVNMMPASRYWRSDADIIIAFRVVKRHAEPRTVLVVYVDGVATAFAQPGVELRFPGQQVEAVQMAEVGE